MSRTNNAYNWIGSIKEKTNFPLICIQGVFIPMVGLSTRGGIESFVRYYWALDGKPLAGKGYGMLGYNRIVVPERVTRYFQHPFVFLSIGFYRSKMNQYGVVHK